MQPKSLCRLGLGQTFWMQYASIDYGMSILRRTYHSYMLQQIRSCLVSSHDRAHCPHPNYTKGAYGNISPISFPTKCYVIVFDVLTDAPHTTAERRSIASLRFVKKRYPILNHCGIPHRTAIYLSGNAVAPYQSYFIK